MSRQNNLLAVSHLLLRLGLVLAVLVMLALPHPGMATVTEVPALTMHHTADGQGQMGHSGGVHDAMNGVLCAMLCAGMAATEGPVHPARFVVFAFARWTIDAGPVWVPFQPDPAQRPPDTPSYA